MVRLMVVGQQLPGADRRIVDGVPDSLWRFSAQALEFPKDTVQVLGVGLDGNHRLRFASRVMAYIPNSSVASTTLYVPPSRVK